VRLALTLFNVQTPLSFTGLNNNNCVAVADLNKDGLSDAVLSNFGTDYSSGAGTTITVLYGKNGGGFNKVQLNTSGQNATFVCIADINGDSWPDVVASNANRLNIGSVSVFRNDGAGNLSLSATPFSTFSNYPAWVGLRDLTGDGVLDVIVGSSGKDNGTGNIVGSNVTILQGNADAQGHGNFTFSGSPITTLALGPGFMPTSLAVADFDGDDLKDIAAAVPSAPPGSGQAQQNGTIYLFRGTGNGGFAAPTQYSTGGALPVDIHAAFLNGDNKPDLVIANAGDPNASPEFKSNSVGVLLNNSSPGNVNFAPPTSLTANCHGTFAIAVDDFNLDGTTDIATVNYGGQSGSPAAFVSIYLGNGSGTFTPASPGTYDTQTGVGGGQYLAVGDFDANGAPDLIVAHASNKVGMLLNTTVRPRVSGSQFAYMTGPQRLNFTFDQNVSASLGLSDITIERLDAGGGAITPASLSYDTTTNTATVSFSGVLADGNYRATLHALGITNSSGTLMASDYVLNFFFLNGDANHDRSVDFNDLVALAQNYNTANKTFAQGDFNYDGNVDFNDLVLLAQRYNTSLPLPGAASMPSASATSFAADWAAATAPPVVANTAVKAPKKSKSDPIFSVTPVNKPTLVKPKPPQPRRRG
jgi:hypothetical protein